MERPRYLPADRVFVEGISLRLLTVRTTDDQVVGRLLGFVVDPPAGRIRSLIVESGKTQLEVPLGSTQLDASCRALRIGEGESPRWREFRAGAVPQFGDDDLLAVLFHRAA
jgi:PRC-barrel domain